MFDRKVNFFLNPILRIVACKLANLGLSANFISYCGLACAFGAFFSITFCVYFLGLIFILLNRVFDGLDGAISRLTRSTYHGGFIDIVFDFIFYAIVPLAFAISSENNSLAAVVLLATFLINGVTFLAYAAIKNSKDETSNLQTKSFYYSPGIVEGTETFAFFCIFCIFPSYFSIFAYVFSLFTIITAFQRAIVAIQEFS